MTNFSFIPPNYSPLAAILQKAEQQVYSDSPYAALLCRKGLEEIIRWMYEHDEDLVLPTDTSLNSLMHSDSFKEIIAPSFFNALNTVRKLGNDAAHSNKQIPSLQALHSLKLIHGFVQWVVNIYAEERIPLIPFDAELIPKESVAEVQRKQLEAVLANYHSQQEELHKAQAQLAEIKSYKEENKQHIPPPVDPNENLTREIYINTLLHEAGWDPHGKNVHEYPVKKCMPQATGSEGDGFVDYVLWGDDGKPLALIEAKRSRKDHNAGQHQAKCYADCLQKEFGQRPVIYLSNGFETSMWDDTQYPPRKVHGFYTKDELQALIFRRTYKKPLSSQKINDAIADRYYQHEAIRKVGETFEQNRREALLVMATGTGKTRVSAAIIDYLSKANWIKRVLFLADRNALIYQAKNNLNDYLPNLPAVDLTREKEDESSRIVFSTYQTMIHMIDGEKDEKKRSYGVGHFDLIIFDEIHRSVYNRYRYIFHYFDGLRLGLTATPRSETHRDTYALFQMEPNNPTYAYELDQAVSDKFLVPPKALSVPVKFMREGIKYAELSEEEKEKYEQEFVNESTGEVPEEIESAALNKWLFNEDTVDKVIGHLMLQGIKVEGGDKLAKTIVFAKSHDHAHFIQDRFNLQYPQYNGHFLNVIDYKADYKYDILNRFKDKTKLPQIAVSVDMLDTGIDVPEVCNLVFFKPVRSSSKYWQMIGRGTRLCKDLFGLNDNKKEFLIFDLCKNFEFFNTQPKGLEPSIAKSLSQRLFDIRLRLAFALVNEEDSDLNQFGQELIIYLQKQTFALEENNFIVRQHLRDVVKYKDPNNWTSLTDVHLSELMHIAPLVSEQDQDEDAKNFDLLMYNLGHYMLVLDKRQAFISEKVRETAKELLKKSNIPMVSAKKETLQWAADKSTWEAMTVLGAEKIRTELRDLLKFIEKVKRPVVYTDFEDELDAATVQEVEIVYGFNDLSAYKRQVEQYLKDKATHITIYKLRNNQPITKGEIIALEQMLFEQGNLGTKEKFEKMFGVQPLGKFIRTIVGLDVNAAKEVFGSLLISNAFNSKQIRFIDTIINFFTVKGIVEPEMLFEAPFTDVNSNGILGLFDEVTSAKIISLIEGVNGNAEVA